MALNPGLLPAAKDFGLSPDEVRSILEESRLRAGVIIRRILWLHMAVALGLATYYDTWFTALSIGFAAIVLFEITHYLQPESRFTRCIAGVSLQTFVALHIYQMHGQPEQHFWFFTAFTAMILYQDWVCMWPGALLIIAQHILFAILHNTGTDLSFFETSYVGFTKLFFHFGIALVQVAVCGLWAEHFRRRTLRDEYLQRCLRNQTETLEGRVTELKSTQAALEVARARAEAGTRAKGDFLATMSHEIRTPMNGVIGMTGLLLDTALQPEQREYAETVRGSADSLLTLLNDILDFSKIEAGKLAIERNPFDLEAVVYEVAALAQFKTEAPDVDLVVHFRPEVPRQVLGDSGRVRQILLNLVGNAIKFTSTGHVLIDVQGSTDRNGLLHVALAVEDTGAGIAADKLPQLFQKFVQADSSTTRKFGGTGLGLAISRQLAVLMGGEIKARSVEGQGSVFTLELPFEVAPQPTLLQTAPQGSRALVLVSRPLQRAAIVTQLRQLGVTPIEVDSEQQLLERSRAELEGAPGAVVWFLEGDRLCEEFSPLLAELEGSPSGPRIKPVLLTRSRRANPWPQRWREKATQVLCMPARSSQLAAGFSASERPPAALPAPLVQHPQSAGADRRLQVLLAEDNPVNTRIVVKILERMNCRVDVAANGREAVEMWRGGNYELILMDCQMPEMDGLQATVKIRELEGPARRVPIIALTANALLEDRARCLEAGMDDYITKPIAREMLERCVLEVRAKSAR